MTTSDTEIMLQKLIHIENLLVEINHKIDNFTGFEELDDDERQEVSQIKKEIEDGQYDSFDDVFGE